LQIIEQNIFPKLKANYKSYRLIFKKPSGTSRGILTTKISYFIFIEVDSRTYIGECGLLQGLSCDDVPEYENILAKVCAEINNYEYWLKEGLINFPSIRFGLEIALLNFLNGDNNILFPSNFTNGVDAIKINGLIWMGTHAEMFQQIEKKLQEGFTCLKLKIGAINFEEEVSLLKYIRENFSANILELRVDANGAFEANEALDKLKTLSTFNLHSIEQPVKAGQYNTMASLCSISPLPIALDEELIGINSFNEKRNLLVTISPQYIILKPSLLGGFSACEEWITIANELNIGWWVTSALESNIGLNAIAQWTYTFKNIMPQGLGTGQLYTNNFDSPLTLRGEFLYHLPNINWQYNNLL
jgi:L-alanine-DL-glutamate epimerase-like enolase superfamily enzyme